MLYAKKIAQEKSVVIPEEAKANSAAMSAWITRTEARSNRRDKLTALLHHLTVDVLRASFFGLKKFAAPGVDEMTWTEYATGLEENLADLRSRVQTGAYRALPSRRTYIPKPDGRQRPLGIAGSPNHAQAPALLWSILSSAHDLMWWTVPAPDNELR
jgi:hypothetical protein